MNTKIYATKAFVQAVKEHRYPHVVLEKIQLLVLNPRHPSLKVHQVRRARKGIWECYASDGDRILYEFKTGELYLWYLGSHALIEKVQCYRFNPEQTFYAFEQNNEHSHTTARLELQKDSRQIRESLALYEPGGDFDGELQNVCVFSLKQLGWLIDGKL